MAKEKNMTAIQNDDDDDDDACSRKTIMSCDNGGVAGPWSDLTHHVLFLVMMQLGVIDFVAFSGVCKSWRSVALTYMNTFMASRPPMLMSTNDEDVDEYSVDGWCCQLADQAVGGRKFKTVLPHSAGSVCAGITCGYVILYELKTSDFWLVNLITRHELHFPNAPNNFYNDAQARRVIATLVFSPSTFGCWVLLVLRYTAHEIWFSSNGEGAWNHVSSTVPMQHLHFFKGKIYTLHASEQSRCETKIIGVMTLDPKESKLTLLETKNFPSYALIDFVCSSEDLYLLQKPCFLSRLTHRYIPHKLDFGEMKWVVPDENTSQEYSYFFSVRSQGAVVKPESWWQPLQFCTCDDDWELCHY